MINSIVCIGDSLTYGKNWGYGSDLHKSLNIRLSEKYPCVSIVNLGVNGELTSNINARKADVNQYNPFRVIVWAGINDITQGVSAHTIESNLQSLYTYFDGLGYEVFAITITPTDNESTAQNTIRSAVNAWIKNTASGIDRVIDAFTAIANPADITKRLPAYADPNTYNHVNDEGMAAIVELF